MAGARWSRERLVADVERLAQRALPREDFMRAAAERMHRAIPAAAICWATLDADTALITSVFSDELVEAGIVPPGSADDAGAALVRGEYLADDANTVGALVARRHPARTLTDATGGRPERSARYRALLRPHGVLFELRAALVGRRRARGAVAVHRREGSHDFTQAETTLLAHLSRPLAEGLAASLRIDAARAGGAGAPGMVLLGPRDHVELMTPSAGALLDVPAERDRVLPPALVAVAAALRGGSPTPGGEDGVTIGGDGGWVTLHAARVEGGRVAIVVEPARPAALAAVRMDAWGLTAREREVVGLVARGRSTAEIAAALVVSPHTVQDHLKAVFEKTGMRSRRRLVALLALSDNLPLMRRGAALDADGRLVPGEPGRAPAARP